MEMKDKKYIYIYKFWYFPRRDWLVMTTLQFLTGTLPQGKVSVMYVPTLCLVAETQKTRPSSATSPDSQDGGWSVTGKDKLLVEKKTLNNYWLDYDGRNIVMQMSVCFDWKKICGLNIQICISSSLDDYNRLVTLCNGTNEGSIQRGLMQGGNMSMPTMNDVRSCLGIRDFDSPPYFTNSSFSFRYNCTVH